jgi:hypothetical protein
MMKNSGTSTLVVDLSFLFTKIKVAYSTENHSWERKYLFDSKKGEERIRLLEDCFEEPTAKLRSFRLPLELLLAVFRNWQKIFTTILVRLRAILGLLI